MQHHQFRLTPYLESHLVISNTHSLPKTPNFNKQTYLITDLPVLVNRSVSLSNKISNLQKCLSPSQRDQKHLKRYGDPRISEQNNQRGNFNMEIFKKSGKSSPIMQPRHKSQEISKLSRLLRSPLRNQSRSIKHKQFESKQHYIQKILRKINIQNLRRQYVMREQTGRTIGMSIQRILTEQPQDQMTAPRMKLGKGKLRPIREKCYTCQGQDKDKLPQSNLISRNRYKLNKKVKINADLGPWISNLQDQMLL